MDTFPRLFHRVCVASAVFASSIVSTVGLTVSVAHAEPYTYAQVSVGQHAACAVTTEGTGLCWGWNRDGYLGTRDTAAKVLAPSHVVLPNGEKFASIVAGDSNTYCGISTAGNTWCWGDHALGNYLTPVSRTPVRVGLPAGTVIDRLSVGGTMACGTDSAAVLWCWGDVLDFGNGSTEATRTPEQVPMPDGAGVTSFDLGPGTSCAVTALDHLYCWGINDDGEVGIGHLSAKVDRPAPVTLPDGNVPARVSVGLDRSCALSVSGDGFCWGDNYQGAFGDGTYTDAPSPRRVMPPGGERLVDLQTAWYHSCATGTSGTTWCWGRGDFGELGTGTTLGGKTWRQPVLPEDVRVAQIAVGLATTCAVDTTSRVWCWTGSTWGVAGTGNETMSLFPRMIAPVGSPTVAAASVSSVGALAATVAGTVNPNGFATSAWVEVDTDPTFGTARRFSFARTMPGGSWSAVTQSVRLTGLAPRTTHHVRVVAMNEAGTVSGHVVTFLTLGSEPTVDTPVVDTVRGTHARSTVSVDPGLLPTTVRWEWSTDATFTEPATRDASPLPGESTESRAVHIDRLQPTTAHWVRAVATNVLGTSASPAVRFETIGSEPSVTDSGAVSTYSSITVSGTVNPGDLETTAWAELSASGRFDDSVASAVKSVGEWSSAGASFTFHGLAPRTGYSVRITAHNALGTTTGATTAVVTKGSVAVVTDTALTSEKSSLLKVSASVNGTGLRTFVTVQVARDAAFVTDLEEQFLFVLTDDLTRTANAVFPGAHKRSTYYARVVATNAAGTVMSPVVQHTVPSPVGIEINQDQDSTMDTAVTLTVTAPADAVAMRVSDSASMKGARVHPVTATLPWTLSPATEPVAQRTVHVQFFAADGTPSPVYSDSIDLTSPEAEVDPGGDDTAPEVTVARVKSASASAVSGTRGRINVTVAGTDGHSGIVRVEFKRAGRITRFTLSAARTISRSFAVASRTGLHVRLVDAAGNASRWSKVRG